MALWVLVTVVSSSSSPASADWPMNRHDNQRTAIASQPSDLAAPAARWRHYLGGSLSRELYVAHDTNGDGEREILYLVGGRLVAKTPADAVVFESEFLDLMRIDKIVDLDGVGGVELVVTASAGRVYVLSLTSGEVLWALPAGVVGNVGAVKFADFNGDGLLDLYVADQGCGSSGSLGDVALAYSFSLGVHTGVQLFTLERGVRDYTCSTNDVIADVDGDGVLEIIAQGSRHFYQFSSVDGALESASPDVGYIPYGQGQTRFVDVDDDGRLELVVFTHNTYATSVRSRRVFVMDYDASAETLVKLWEVSVADLDADSHGFGDAGVGDIDGDGDYEVATSFTSGGAWRTVILDAATGLELAGADIGPYRGLVDLTGDGHPEVVTGSSAADGFRVYALADGALELLWSGSSYGPVYARDWRRPGESARTRLQAFDVTGDGATELLLIRYADAAPPTLVAISIASSPDVVAELSAPEDATFQSFEQYAGVTRPYKQLLLVRSDGYLLVLDQALSPTNYSTADEFSLGGMRIGGYYSGGSGLGYPATAADLDGDGAAEVVVRNSVGALLRLNPLGANLIQPPAEAWRLSASRSPHIFARDGAPVIAAFSGSGLALYDAEGAELWRRSTSSPTGDLVVGDVDGDSSPDIAYMRTSQEDVVINAVDSAGGSDLWSAPFVTRYAGSGLGQMGLWDQDGDGVLDLLTTPRNQFTWLAGATGEQLVSVDGHYPGMPLFYDVDGDDQIEVINSGSHHQPSAFELDLEPGWSADVDSALRYTRHYGAVAPCADGPRFIQAVYNQPRVQIFAAASGALLADIALAGGELYPEFADAPAQLGRIGNITVSPDLVGEDRASALAPSTDGFLYAIDVCDVELDWAVDFRHSVGEAVFADLDGDGADEILVSVADGYLYAVDTEIIAAPGYVVDRSGADSIAGDDVDEVETLDTLWAEWQPVAGATGYEYAVITPGGTFLTNPDFIAAGTQTRVQIAGLPLVLGGSYRVAVRALAAGGASAEALSDGVMIVDVNSPEVTLSAEPMIFSPVLEDFAPATTIGASLADRRLLAGAEWQIETLSGEIIVGPVAAPEASGRTYQLSFSWDGRDAGGELVEPGTYRVTVRAADELDHIGVGSIEVTIADPTAAPPGSPRVLQGCSATIEGGRSSLATVLLLMLGLVLARRKRRALAPLAAALLLSLGAPAHAQESTAYDPAIDVQLFEYATGPHSFLSVADADVSGAGQLSFDFVLTFITSPLTIYNVDDNQEEISGSRMNVVDRMLAGEIGAAYGLADKLQLSMSMPLVFALSGDRLEQSKAALVASGFQASGLGDLRVELKWRAWQGHGLRVALLPGATLPTSVGSGSNDFLGDDLPTARLRGAVQWSDPGGKLTMGANVGAILRKPRTIYASEVGQQLAYGLAANFAVTPRIHAIGEAFGRSGLEDIAHGGGPLELLGGLRVRASDSMTVVAGAGGGVVKGIGSPGLRMFLSVGWAPDLRDRDGDGIGDKHDRCPLRAEDRDDFEDLDGCPDEDNDGDRHPDAVDKCPNQAEDLDGFADDDGCPEVDADGDAVLDEDDQCPNEAEDGEAPWSKDGCPLGRRDSDHDGIVDAHDYCPDQAEDEDGFEDWDGCPEEDNDADGILDEYDRCALCREDVDGVDDDDGCPEADGEEGFFDDVVGEAGKAAEAAPSCPDGYGAFALEPPRAPARP